MTIHVRWLGHATTLLELDGTRILTDPVLTPTFSPLVRRRAGDAPILDPLLDQSVDAVLISHAHHDHLHLPSLRLVGDHARVVVPSGLGRWLARRGVRHVDELAVGARTSVGSVEVRATPAAHDGRRLLGPVAEAVGYTVEGSASLYFAGDTDLFDSMVDVPRGIGDRPDVALLPVGGWGPTLRGGHLDPRRAAEALRLLRPREVVPIHWGTFWPRGLDRIRPHRFHHPAVEFLEAARSLTPEVRVRILKHGAALNGPRNLPSARAGAAPHELLGHD